MLTLLVNNGLPDKNIQEEKMITKSDQSLLLWWISLTFKNQHSYGIQKTFSLWETEALCQI